MPTMFKPDRQLSPERRQSAIAFSTGKREYIRELDVFVDCPSAGVTGCY